MSPVPAGSATARRRSFLDAVSVSMFLDLLRLADHGAVALGSLLGFLVFAVPVHGMLDQWPAVAGATVLASLLTGRVLNRLGVYRLSALDRGLNRGSYRWLRCVAGWTAALSALIVLAFLVGISAEFSRGWLLIWWGGTAVALGMVRIGASRVLSAWQQAGRLRQVVAIVGATDQARRVHARLGESAGTRLDIIGVFDDRTGRTPDSFPPGLLVGDTDRLLAHCRRHRVDQIVIALPLSAEQRLRHLMRKLWEVPANISLDLDLAGRTLPMGRMTSGLGSPMLQVIDQPFGGWNGLAKEVFDKIFSSVVLLVLSPLLLGIAVAIRLDSPGPVLFHQRRFGFKNRSTTIYKFRTMHTHLGDASGSIRTCRADVRVTRVGLFLRRTSLDELPQFINVLQGRMSVVGPRPHPLAMRAADRLYHEAVEDYLVRHRVKPGITGWAQVNGLRGETDTMEKARARIALDLFYIENWSLLFDLKIILMTTFRSLHDSNAY